jgi:2-octaprenyl-6-methoxyphenol hydroxylase
MTDAGKRFDYDVVIAGGGMIGTSLALALSPLGLRVAVVEAVARGAASQPSFDDRSTALSRSTQRMFEAMGLWNQIRSASTPIRQIHVSEKGRFGFSHIDADEQKVAALGYVVINRVLGDVLQQALVGDPSIDLICPAKITAISLAANAASATILHDGGEAQQISCRLIAAADGSNSSVREMMGIGASQSQYGQRAVIGNLLPEKPLENIAYERFTDRGPLALLPVADERAAFVWNVDEKDADRIMDLDDDAFVSELQAAFGYRLGRFSRIGKRAAYPLILSKALRLTATRSVLVGNAAHGLHPVAAQGFNLGMRDVAALCDCIADACADPDADIGSQELLARFANWRKADQTKLVRFTDGLVQLFASRKPSVRLLRNAGMLAFDFVPGVRSEFARHTMGLAGRLPRLSRGVPLR